MFPGPIRVFIPRFMWRVVSPDAPSSLVWGGSFFEAVFQKPNEWSIRDYWLRSTFGLMDLSFELGRNWQVLERAQSELRDDRGGMIAACRSATEELGVSLAGFDHVVCFVNPPPCNAGANGELGDVVLDQAGSLEMYQHEIGHLLGFEHAWGRPGVYNDPYCVMGFTGPLAHDIPRPPEFSDVVTLASDFWRSGRRVSAASLYRLFIGTRFGGSGQLTSGLGAAGAFDDRVIHTRLGSDPTIAALSQARNQPVIAVVPIPSGGVLTVEYRTAAGDDVGVDPAVVVHTLGSRSIGPGHHEVDPPWFEVAFPPQIGLGATIAIRGTGYRVEVIDREDEPAVPSVRVALLPPFPVPENAHQQPGWRWCAKCQGMTFEFGSTVGECPAGMAHDHGPSGLYSVLHNFPPPAVQPGWRWCAKCQGLAFAEAAPGQCAAGGTHDHAGSGRYHLLHGVEMAGEPGWRWCAKCQLLASGVGTPGPCPAGGTHDHSGSGHYSMPRDVSLPTAQAGWRECDKCRGLIFGGGSSGRCPAGGTHQLSLIADYSVLHDLSEPTSQDNWRWCSKCQGLVFGGGGPGACPAGGTHDLSTSGNYTLLHGVQVFQTNWRWCVKCQGLAFGGGDPGRCPAGGTHDHSRSGIYTMLPEPPQVWP